jgi:type III restriction enzyme
VKIRFDGNQQYQLDAIDAVLDVFEGQPLAAGTFETRLDSTSDAGGLFSELGSGNLRTLTDDAILANTHRVQHRNGIPPIERLAGMNFSVEMETGTGKTYVYLRTIHELHRRHGFSKFIVVVPSVAIREGVMTSIRMTQGHFSTVFGNPPVDCWVYDSRQVSRLRQFAGATTLQVLVINIDAFNKQSNNIIHRQNDRLSGRKPIEFIRAACPVVIMDEPQNMESEQAHAAIASLNPLCTLRYSATHRNPYNLLYRLDPVRAYDLKLVKRIEVDSVLDEADFNQPYIHVRSIKATTRKITAKLDIDVNAAGAPRRSTITLTDGGTDLLDKSKGRENYRGYIVDEIDAGNQRISFTNGVVLGTGQTHGGRTDDVMQVQVRETVREHFEKELRIRRTLPEGQRLKVLSLFFIDRVANYAPADGKIRQWFTDTYKELAASPKYRELEPLPAEKVHNGYFAQDKNGPKDSKLGKDEQAASTEADNEAYELIMRHKERLLSPDEPLRFIFSHSALREGWDNPNVFQICTLNETRSEIRKRQEIGRGLRLPVIETGERCFDPSINRLTVIANESYESFAAQLQTEIQEEFGVSFEGRIANKKKQRTARLKPGWKLNPDFKALWEQIKHKTRYGVDYDSQVLVEMAAARFADMDKIQPARITVQKGDLEISEQGLRAAPLASRAAAVEYRPWKIPDLLSYLQAKTELTRRTLAEILIRSGRLAEVKTNPQQFLDQVLQAIQAELRELMIAGIKYERIAGQEYEMLLFEEKEITGYLTSMIEVEKSIYDVIPWESEVERKFAEAMNSRQDIKLFVKLPPWFQIETPIGTYNPDWAIVKEGDTKIYLVRETKSTTEQLRLRGAEWAKIQCGKAHFGTLAVDFAHVTSHDQV